MVTYYGVLEALHGIQLETGKILDHWCTSTTCFTMIVIIIMFKLLIETVYWNIVSLSFIGICLALYFIIILMGNVNAIAIFFQPQVNG